METFPAALLHWQPSPHSPNALTTRNWKAFLEHTGPTTPISVLKMKSWEKIPLSVLVAGWLNNSYHPETHIKPSKKKHWQVESKACSNNIDSF